MAVSFNVGQKLPLSIAFLDQFGSPLKTPVTPDSAPAWTVGAPAIDALTVAADGLSAIDLGETAGSDNVGLTVVVGGASFTASLAVTVNDVPRVLTSVQIVAGTPA